MPGNHFQRCSSTSSRTASQVTRIGNPEFADSGLTLAAHRGGGFVGVSALADRVTAALTAMTGGGRTLSYLYWGDLDTAGHQHGWRSPNWQAELGRVDRAVADLAARMPSGAVLVVTADHGMVDVPHARRLDLATAPRTASGHGDPGRRTETGPAVLPRRGRRRE